MQLLYVWIEKYKNIKKQGFNFSSEFLFEYDDKNRELTIKDNPNYIDGFFEKNISNVTAIVGKNGSGKSSILEAILNEKIAFFCYKDINNQININCNKDINNQINTTINNILPKKIINNTKYKYNKDNLTNNNLIIYYHNNFKSFNYNSIYDTTFHNNNNLKIISTDYLLQDKEDINGSKINNNYTTNFSIDEELIQDFFLKETIKQIYLFNEFKNWNTYIKIPKSNKLIISSKLEEAKKKLKNNSTLTSKEQNIFLSYFNDKEESFIDNNNVYNFVHLYEKIIKTIKPWIAFNWEKEYSSGELALLILYSRLFHINKDIENRNDIDIFILIDEGETGFHPEWQREYVHNLITILPKIFEGKKLQIILTSHSPFVISDLPKENVIFLDTYKEESKDKKEGEEEYIKGDIEVKNGLQKTGNCKVVKGIEKEQTFGANIHTLLSDGFFMEGGLMGEFANNKIKEVINWIKDKREDKKEEIQKIIKMIGEDVLRMSLSEYFMKQFRHKINQISLEDREQELLNELEEIRKRKNQS